MEGPIDGMLYNIKGLHVHTLARLHLNAITRCSTDIVPWLARLKS